MEKNLIYNELKNKIDEQSIKIDELLSNHTFTKLGGKADFLIFPKNYEELINIYKIGKKYDQNLTIIGFGSNLIIKDGGIRGIVVSLTKLNSITVIDDVTYAQSGASIIDVSKIALSSNLSGLEFACGIPGSVGGAVYMNAGAYEGEIKDVLDYIIVMNNEGKIIKKSNKELKFSYRYSILKENKEIVLEAVFKLKKGNYEDIKNKMNELNLARSSKQPLEYPSCGSVFKRPNGYYAGKLIQDSSLQGTRFGGAEVSKKHAGFIVNIDNASAHDYITLIKYIQTKVKEKFNVELETEVEIIGEE